MRTKLDGVKVENSPNGLIYHIPEGMSGEAFKVWKEKNKIKLNNLKQKQ